MEQSKPTGCTPWAPNNPKTHVSRLQLPVFKAPSEGTQVKPPPHWWVECNRRNSPMSFARLQTRPRHSSAFTLVELMIVIAIVGVLASLVTVGVMKGLEKGKQVAARTEISQLEAAIAAAKQNFGNVDNLPSVLEFYSNGPNFKAAADAVTMTGAPLNPLTRNTFNFFTKVFGRNWYSNTTLQWLGNSVPVANYQNQPKQLTSMEALTFLLGGYVDSSGASPKFLGFSSNPLNPMDVTNTKYKVKGPFYEFDASRLKTGTNFFTYRTGWDGPYAYHSSADYTLYTVAPLPFKSSATAFINPKTFQLVNSGPDQLLGSGGLYSPGNGDYALGGVGYDDLANFSSTQLGKKDE